MKLSYQPQGPPAGVPAGGGTPRAYPNGSRTQQKTDLKITRMKP